MFNKEIATIKHLLVSDKENKFLFYLCDHNKGVNLDNSTFDKGKVSCKECKRILEGAV